MKKIKQVFINDLKNELLLQKDCQDWVLRIFDLFCNFENYANLLNESMQSNKLTLPSYNSDDKAFCSNCRVLNNYVYLGFADNGNDFWIIQYNSNLIGLYLEEHNIFITRLKSEKLKILKYILDIKESFTKNRNQNILEFAGIYFGSPRPHHFFADYLSALYQYMTLHGVQNLTDVTFYGKKGNFFFPLIGFTNTSINLELINDDELNLFLIKNNKFIIKMVRGDEQSYDNFNFLEHLICASTFLGRQDKQLVRVLNKLNNSDYVVWIGISSEKRSWLEQKKFIKLLIDYLLKRYKNPTVVFDGITSTIDNKNISPSDKAFFSSIRKENQQTNLNLFLISSFQSYQKLVLATNVDFFISNTGADLLYPAKFALVKGIGYAANAFGQKSSHHYRTFKIDSEWIEDQFGTDEKVIDPTRVSFSICPNKVFQLFRKVYDMNNNLYLETVRGSIALLKSCDQYKMYNLCNLTDKFETSIVLQDSKSWNPSLDCQQGKMTVKFSAISEDSIEIRLSFDLFVNNKKTFTYYINEGKDLILECNNQFIELKNFKILFKGIGRVKFYDISII